MNIQNALCLAASPVLGAAAEAAVAFGTVLGFVALCILLWVLFDAVFIHIAMRIVGWPRPFGKAILAVFYSVLVSFVLVILASFFFPLIGHFLLGLAANTIAIMIAYEAEIWRSLLGAFISWLLATICVVGTIFVLFLALGLTIPFQLDRQPQPAPPPEKSIQARVGADRVFDMPRGMTYIAVG